MMNCHVTSDIVACDSWISLAYPPRHTTNVVHLQLTRECHLFQHMDVARLEQQLASLSPMMGKGGRKEGGGEAKREGGRRGAKQGREEGRRERREAKRKGWREGRGEKDEVREIEENLLLHYCQTNHLSLTSGGTSLSRLLVPTSDPPPSAASSGSLSTGTSSTPVSTSSISGLKVWPIFSKLATGT